MLVRTTYAALSDKGFGAEAYSATLKVQSYHFFSPIKLYVAAIWGRIYYDYNFEIPSSKSTFYKDKDTQVLRLLNNVKTSIRELSSICLKWQLFVYIFIFSNRFKFSNPLYFPYDLISAFIHFFTLGI